METQQPILPDQYDSSFKRQLLELLSRNYTDLFQIFDKTAVSDPAAMGNMDGEISGLTFSNPPTQAECQALRNACEVLADDVRALRGSVSDLIDSLQARDLV